MFDSRYSANASRWKDRFVAETAWKDSLPVAFQGTSRTRTVNGLDPGVAFASTYTSTACITPREKSRVTFGLPFGPVIARAIWEPERHPRLLPDRKSTRLNSSHVKTSY